MSMLLSLVMVISLLPVTAAATGSDPDESKGVALSKRVELQKDGTYTITLESYAVGEVTSSSAKVPTDVVMVLDVSGSMKETLSKEYQEATDIQTYLQAYECQDALYFKTSSGDYKEVDKTREYRKENGEWVYKYTLTYRQNYSKVTIGTQRSSGDAIIGVTLYRELVTTKIAALRTAAKAFVDTMAAQNAAGGDNRISIVKFAGENKDTVGNEVYNDNTYNYTQIVTILEKVDSSNAETIKSTIQGINLGGATSADWGLKHAQTVLQDSSPDRAKVVIFFTDGQPNHPGDGSNIRSTVARDAIKAAYDLKSSGTKIYSIAVYDDADPDDTSKKFNQYMHAVSSNYPTADATATEGRPGSLTVTLGDRAASSDFYKKVENAADLNRIFREISNSVSNPSIQLGSQAVLRDIVNTSSFTLPAGFTAENVTVETVNYLGRNGDGTRNWSATATPLDDPKVTYDVKTGTVNVSGFDYSANYAVDASADGQVQTGGKKLIVTITGVEAKAAAATGKNVYTNDADSGLYSDNTQVVPVATFNRPTVRVMQANYVLDYGGMARLDVSADALELKEVLYLRGAMGKIDPLEVADDSINGAISYGGVKVVDNSTIVEYTPNGSEWGGFDTFYAFGQNTDGSYQWVQLNVMPANNVYFEEEASKNPTQIGDGVSVVEGKAGDATYLSDVHGYDAAYDHDTGDSAGSSIRMSPGQTQSFTFTGTGVDV